MLHKLTNASAAFVQAVSCFDRMLSQYDQTVNGFSQYDQTVNGFSQPDLLRAARLSMLRFDKVVLECAPRDSGFDSDLTAQVHNVGEYYLNDALSRSQLHVKTAFVTHRMDIVFVSRTIKGETEVLTGNYHVTTDLINLVGDFEDKVAQLYLEGLYTQPLIADLPLKLRNTVLCTLKDVCNGAPVGSAPFMSYASEEHQWKYFDIDIPSVRLPEVKLSTVVMAFEKHASNFNLPKDEETIRIIHLFMCLLHKAALGKYWMDVPSLTHSETDDCSEKLQYHLKGSKTKIELYFQKPIEDIQEEFEEFIAELNCGELEIEPDVDKEITTRNIIIAIQDRLAELFLMKSPVAKEMVDFRSNLISEILKSYNQSTLFERLTEIVMTRSPRHPTSSGKFNLLVELVTGTQLCFVKNSNTDLRIAMSEKKITTDIIVQSGMWAFMNLYI